VAVRFRGLAQLSCAGVGREHVPLKHVCQGSWSDNVPCPNNGLADMPQRAQHNSIVVFWSDMLDMQAAHFLQILPVSLTLQELKPDQHTCRTGCSAHTCTMRLSSDASRLRWQWPRLSIRMVLGIRV
jgi:hypothetical protein